MTAKAHIVITQLIEKIVAADAALTGTLLARMADTEAAKRTVDLKAAAQNLTSALLADVLIPPQPEKEEALRAEVRDKLSVYAAAQRDPIPLQKAVFSRQVEDFLVEMILTASAEVVSLQPAKVEFAGVQPRPWRPKASGDVYYMLVDANNIVVGGGFSSAEAHLICDLVNRASAEVVSQPPQEEGSSRLGKMFASAGQDVCPACSGKGIRQQDDPHTGDDELLDALTEARIALEEVEENDEASLTDAIADALQALGKADALRVAQLASAEGSIPSPTDRGK